MVNSTKENTENKTSNEKSNRKLFWMIGTVAITLILFGDVIVGRIYFYSLCNTQGGQKIYKTVELPAEYWNEDGSPIFLNKKGNKIKSGLDEIYSFRSIKIKDVPLYPQIMGYKKIISIKQSNEVLGTYTKFYYFGGWLVNSQPFHVSGRHCPIEPSYYTRLLENIFLKNKVDQQ